MGLFSKSEYIEVVLPYIYDNDAEDVAAGVITIEAYGYILDEHKYCYASFSTEHVNYDELSELLITADTKLVKVIAKVKNGKVRDFKLDLNDLAERYNNSQLAKLSLLGWGLNEQSFADHIATVKSGE